MVIKSAAWLGSEAGRRGRGGSEAGGRGAEEARAAALRGHADAREPARPGPVHSQGPREQRLILYILSYKDDFSMYIAEAPWSAAEWAVALLFVELLQAQLGRQVAYLLLLLCRASPPPDRKRSKNHSVCYMFA